MSNNLESQGANKRNFTTNQTSLYKNVFGGSNGGGLKVIESEQ